MAKATSRVTLTGQRPVPQQTNHTGQMVDAGGTERRAAAGPGGGGAGAIGPGETQGSARERGGGVTTARDGEGG